MLVSLAIMTYNFTPFLKVCFFFTKIFEKKFCGSNCSSFILQLNAENRINIRAVYNAIHVFKLFLYGIYMVAFLSQFWVVYYQSSKYEWVIYDNFSYFSSKPYVVTPHLNRLIETVQMRGHVEAVQMRGHNIWFCAELTNIIPNYHQILPLI